MQTPWADRPQQYIFILEKHQETVGVDCITNRERSIEHQGVRIWVESEVSVDGTGYLSFLKSE